VTSELCHHLDPFLLFFLALPKQIMGQMRQDLKVVAQLLVVSWHTRGAQGHQIDLINKSISENGFHAIAERHGKAPVVL
jgi:hypothetical protein